MGNDGTRSECDPAFVVKASQEGSLNEMDATGATGVLAFAQVARRYPGAPHAMGVRAG